MMERRRGCIGIAGAVLLVAAGGSGGDAGERAFSLEISGSAGVRYTGRCTLTTAAGEEAFELSGVVPRHEAFTGQGLACTIESAGSIAVEIAHGAERTRSVTSGGTVRIAVR